MRILVVTWEYPPYVVGGMGKHVAELVPALGGQATQDGPLYVDVVTTRYGGGAPEEQLNEFVTIHRVDLPPFDPVDHYNSVVGYNYLLVRRALELAERKPYDLIHAHDWLVGRAGIRLKHHWKAPLITTIHATERGRHQGHLPSDTSYQIDRMEWQSCFEAWKVIACSNFMSQELQDFFELPVDKIAVIPNGINAGAINHCSTESRALLRQRYAPNGEHLLLYVGRIVYEKGLHVLIRAMPRILAEYPDTRLLVAGKNAEKVYPQAYELNVERSVDLLGFVSDAERDCLYQTVDAAIFPSLYEPFGIVALEAMAAGCNVIASSVGGLGEIVRHLENGLTVYPGDAMSIVWAVNQLLADPAAAATRRAQALAEIRRRYNWDSIAAETARLYEQVVEERRNTDW
ncbi:MAG: glycosyltransferase family 4 protein [Caldilineaceae bacterium]|nr:glycosyltransferase family 4 protein [Caldilineaceae bacterium]